MRCVICKHGETKQGLTTVTLARGASAFVIQNVPARICENCGEKYVGQKTSDALLKSAEMAYRLGAKVEVREYKAA